MPLEYEGSYELEEGTLFETMGKEKAKWIPSFLKKIFENKGWKVIKRKGKGVRAMYYIIPPEAIPKRVITPTPMPVLLPEPIPEPQIDELPTVTVTIQKDVLDELRRINMELKNELQKANNRVKAMEHHYRVCKDNNKKLGMELAKRDVAINNLNENNLILLDKIEKKDRAINGLIGERDYLRISLNKQIAIIAEKDTAINNLIVERDNLMGSLTEERAAMHAKISSQKDIITNKQNEIDNLELELKACYEEYEVEKKRLLPRAEQFWQFFSPGGEMDEIDKMQVGNTFELTHK